MALLLQKYCFTGNNVQHSLEKERLPGFVFIIACNKTEGKGISISSPQFHQEQN